MARYKRRRSRLTRKEEARSLRKAVLFGLLTILIALGLLFLGIPLLIRMAIFVGNLRSTSQPIENQDILPPSPVRLQPLPEATNSAQIKIEGFAEAGSTVEVFKNGSSVKKVVAETDGTFSAGEIALSSERNELYAVAIDEAGNKSQASEKFLILFDQEPPAIEELNPPNETEISSDENRITLTGKTEPKSSVTINERVVIVSSEGGFEYPVSLSDGENKIKIVVIDQAGNQTEEEITLIYSP